MLCKGIAEPRGTVCRDVVNYILCGISYSRAKIGHVSRSCLGEDLMLNLMRENAWNSVKQQVLGAVAYPGILFGGGGEFNKFS